MAKGRSRSERRVGEESSSTENEAIPPAATSWIGLYAFLMVRIGEKRVEGRIVGVVGGSSGGGVSDRFR